MNPIVNDFSIQVATVNGSGSQSANMVLMRSIFNMGVPVSGKNLFPSNIAGLPTWFTIRASKKGYIARKKDLDILVLMNAQTVDDDMRALRPGAFVVFNDALATTVKRDDVTVYNIPFTTLVGEIAKEMKLRKLLVNMIYVGIVGELLGIDDVCIERAIEKQFKGKQKAADLNKLAVAAGRRYAKEHPPAAFGFKLERMHATEGKIIIEGNAAAAMGAVFGGLTVLAWYPITPSSSVCEYAIDYLERFRHTPDGKATYCVVQAEDELASIGMVIGASWAGARAMTSTAGPGISLMSEFVGLAYYAEVPAVIWDVQRVGPSTGLPTRTAQGDIRAVAGLSHGDTKHIALIPATVEECYHYGMLSFDLAEQFQTPVFVLSDLDLGMNNWMSDPFPYVDQPFVRGKVLSKEQLEQLPKFERYKDVDGDGVPYRTIPGTDHERAAYFTRGSGHNEAAQYSEKPEDYANNMARLARKYETARKAVPVPIVERDAGASIGLIAYGTTHHAIIEAREQLRAEGLKTHYLRLRALPLTDDLTKFLRECERVYVVEQNRDGQMTDLVRLHAPELAGKVQPILHYCGLPIDARSITDGVLECEKVEVA